MGRQSNAAFSALLLCVALASEASLCAAKHRNTTKAIPKIRRNYGPAADADNSDNSGSSWSQPSSSGWQQPQPSNEWPQPSSQTPSQPRWGQQQPQPTQGWKQPQPQPGQECVQPQPQPDQGWAQSQPHPGQGRKQPQSGQRWAQPQPPSTQQPSWSSLGNSWQPQQPSWSNQQSSASPPSSVGWVSSLKRRQFVVEDASNEQQPNQNVIIQQATIAANGTVVGDDGQLVPFAGVGYVDSNGVIHFHRLANGPATQLPPSTASSFQSRKMFRDNGDDNLDDNEPNGYVEGETVILVYGFVTLPNGETIPFDGVGTINGSGSLIFHQIVNTQNADDSSSKLLRRQGSVLSGAVQLADPVAIFNEEVVDENGNIVDFNGLCFVDANNLIYYYLLNGLSDASSEETPANITSEVVSRQKRQIDVDDSVDVDDDSAATPTGYVLGQLDEDGHVSGPNGELLTFGGVGSIDANGVLLYHPVIAVVEMSDLKRVRRQGVPQQQAQSAPASQQLAPVQPDPQQSQPQFQADVISDSDEEGDDWQQFNVYETSQQQQLQQQEPFSQQQQDPKPQNADIDSGDDLNGDNDANNGQQPQGGYPVQSAPVSSSASVSDDVSAVEVPQTASDVVDGGDDDEGDNNDDSSNDGWTYGGGLSRA